MVGEAAKKSTAERKGHDNYPAHMPGIVIFDFSYPAEVKPT
jgi:hypothetical protein